MLDICAFCSLDAITDGDDMMETCCDVRLRHMLLSMADCEDVVDEV